MVDIPTPNQKELKKYLNQWDSLPDYVKQENSLNKLFRKLIPNNTNKDNFCKFKHEDLKNYLCFKKVLIEFINYYSLDCGLKDLDRYLRQLWKKHFPKKY